MHVQGGALAREFSYDEAFSRNIGWVTRAEQQALRGKCVAIAGLGGVGGVHLLTLARLGIGRFRIADFDAFDLANFNRQVGAGMSTLGQRKTDVLARMARDVNPEVEIVAPKPGATLGRKTTLRWQVADPDSPGSAMMYHVAYSPDGGRSFYPVDVNLRATSVTFDATNLPRSEGGRGLLRVFVSDGLNSGFTDLSRLNNPASRFTVPSRGR